MPLSFRSVGVSWCSGLAAVALACAALSACDGSAQPVRAQKFDGGIRDGGADVRAQTPDTGDFVFPDAAPALPKATPNADAKRIVGPGATLVGGGARACTNQVPASGNGDRWCAFHQVGAKSQRDELWVINVTKAAVASVSCDGTDSNCLRLSNNLWTGSTDDVSHPYAHAFTGDTLTFLSGRADLFETSYEGVIYAWRPGMAKARAISGPQGFDCTAHERSPVVMCLENLDIDNAGLFHFDVRAGRLDDGSEALPPLIDSILPLRKNDTLGWQGGFSPAGDMFMYSNLKTAANDDPETLYAYKIEDLGVPAKRIEVGKKLSRAQLSGDGKRLYSLKDYNYDRTGSASGTLVVQDFPSGANAADVMAKVGVYFPLGTQELLDKGLVVMTELSGGVGTAKYIGDVAARAQANGIVEISRSVSDVQPAGALPFVIYSKRISGDLGTMDLNVFRTGAGAAPAAPQGSCALQKEPSTLLLSDPFVGKGSLAVWADNVDLDNGIVEGWTGNPTDCTGQSKFATRMGAWRIVGDKGVLFIDDYDFITSSTLRYAPVAGTKLGPAVTLQEQIAASYFGVVGENANLVIYGATNTVGDQNGLYLLAKLPWTSPAPSDGGVAPVADASAGN